MQKSIIIANTLYQLTVAIHIKYLFLKESETDLFVCSETPLLNEIVRGEYIKNIFKTVYFVPFSNLDDFEKRKGNYTHTDHLKRFLLPSHFLREMNCNIDVYDDIFFYAPNRMFKDIYKYCKSKNKDVKLHYYHHGAETYMGSVNIEGFSDPQPYRFLLKFLWNIDFKAIDFDMYCYSPEYLPKNEDKKIVKIESLQPGSEVTNLINKAFQYKQEEFISQKYIFFEQASEYIKDESKYKKCINSIAETVGSHNIILKKHPRLSFEYDNRIPVYKGKESWELYLLNNDCSNKVLITVSSTACSAAKTMFGMNCRIIYLYKLLGDIISQEVLSFCPFIESTVDNKNVFLPSSLEEMYRILREV